MTLEQLAKYFNCAIPENGCVIFQVPQEMMADASRMIMQITPVFRNRNISCLLFNDEAHICMVPEAQKAFGMPTPGRA